ncbi:MAG TPA: hypothetical protein VKX39_08130 [Bryobacteraceae bacterium]|jgi:hypothetical protein|nr:hypothetical protein [Bryobacteraceae bacterium]
MLSFAVLFAFAAAVFAQSADAISPDLALLAKIRSRVIWNLHRLPDYTCVETVERDHRRSASHRFELLDTIRLEVALVDGREMFGWPGAKSFEDMDARRLISRGAFSNGNFANHARAIFAGGFTRFTYKGEAMLGDGAAARFDYEIPQFGSSYLLSAGGRQATVGYHGSIYADPKTFDVQRIEVIADEIPAGLGLARAMDRMDYARVPIGEGDFLLPRESELTMSDVDGAENRNRVRLASCRQFTGQSTLTFREAALQEAAPLSEVDLPRDISLEFRLASDIDTHTAAVGDPVRAVLETDIKQRGQILFQKGARVLGRITRLERGDGEVLVGLDFFSIESAGERAPLKLQLEDVAGGEFLNPSPRRAVPAARPGEGIIPLGPGHFRLNRGILMFWRTEF